MQPTKVAPSEFAFLYRECDRCAVLKLRDGVARPFMPFPSVFQSIDKSVRGLFEGMDVSKISPDIPSGKLATKSKVLKGEVAVFCEGYEDAHTFLISGKTDAIVEHADGSLSILDFKVSGRDVSGEAQRYACQLAAYALAARQTLGKPDAPIRALGLVVFSPGGMQPGMGQSYPLMMEMQYVPIDPAAAMKDLITELSRIAALLREEYPADPDNLPPASPKCAVCAAFEKRRALSDMLPVTPDDTACE